MYTNCTLSKHKLNLELHIYTAIEELQSRKQSSHSLNTDGNNNNNNRFMAFCLGLPR